MTVYEWRLRPPTSLPPSLEVSAVGLLCLTVWPQDGCQGSFRSTGKSPGGGRGGKADAYAAVDRDWGGNEPPKLQRKISQVAIGRQPCDTRASLSWPPVSGLMTVFVPLIPCWCRMILCTTTRVEAVNAEVTNSQVPRDSRGRQGSCIVTLVLDKGHPPGP